MPLVGSTNPALILLIAKKILRPTHFCHQMWSARAEQVFAITVSMSVTKNFHSTVCVCGISCTPFWGGLSSRKPRSVRGAWE